MTDRGRGHEVIGGRRNLVPRNFLVELTGCLLRAGSLDAETQSRREFPTTADHEGHEDLRAVENTKGARISSRSRPNVDCAGWQSQPAVPKARSRRSVFEIFVVEIADSAAPQHYSGEKRYLQALQEDR